MTIWTNVSRVIFVIIIYYHCNWHEKLDKEREMESIQISVKWTNDTMAYKSIIEGF